LQYDDESRDDITVTHERTNIRSDSCARTDNKSANENTSTKIIANNKAYVKD